jgi:hypothetical protein
MKTFIYTADDGPSDIGIATIVIIDTHKKVARLKVNKLLTSLGREDLIEKIKITKTSDLVSGVIYHDVQKP